MKLSGNGLSPQRARLVKGLSLCFAFTLVASLLVSGWYGLTSRYSAVLNPDEIAVIQLDAPKRGYAHFGKSA